MRTSRLSRWVLSGALVAAGVVAGFGGQAAAGDTGAQAVVVESSDGDQGVAPAQAEDDGDVIENDGYEWG